MVSAGNFPSMPQAIWISEFVRDSINNVAMILVYKQRKPDKISCVKFNYSIIKRIIFDFNSLSPC